MPLVFVVCFITFVSQMGINFTGSTVGLSVKLSRSTFTLNTKVFFTTCTLFNVPTGLVLGGVNTRG